MAAMRAGFHARVLSRRTDSAASPCMKCFHARSNHRRAYTSARSPLDTQNAVVRVVDKSSATVDVLEQTRLRGSRAHGAFPVRVKRSEACTCQLVLSARAAVVERPGF